MVQLRARKARKSYAIHFPDISDDEDQPQPSSSSGDDGQDAGEASTSIQSRKRPKRRAPSRAESEASGSNFSADSKNKPASEESEEVSDAAADELLLSDADGSIERRNDLDDDDESVLDVGSSRRGRANRGAIGGSEQTKIGALPGRHERTGPLPHLVSKDVTARPTPLYTPPEGSLNKRRLLREPSLYAVDLYGTHAEQTRDRVSRKWSQVVSPGPAWELLEDVSWHKEHFINETSPAVPKRQDAMDVDEKPSSLRPHVYHSVKVDPENIQLLSSKDAWQYLPSHTVSKSEDEPESSSLPPPIPCYFGPFGGQSRVELEALSSYPLSEYMEDSRAHVFNAGAAVWGLDWCPIEESNALHRKGKQYLAVGPSTSQTFSPTIGSRLSRPAPACIQIWSIGTGVSEEDEGVMRCEMVLCVDCGPAQSLKWCPLPSHDTWSDKDEDLSSPDAVSPPPRKLSILGGVFADGSITFWLVPDPEDMRSLIQNSPASGQEGRHESDVLNVKLKEPLLRIELEDVPFWSLDWANSEVVAAGTTNGIIAVYHVKDHLNGKATEGILPTYFRRVHQSAIRSLAWMKLPPSNGSGRFCLAQDPTIICSVGYDGQVLFVDVRDEVVNEMARYRDVINSVVFAPWTGGPVWTESETIKWGSISPTEIGRGHLTMQTVGSVWSLSVSDYHPFLAVGSADGSCHTTNLLKVMRQRFNGARVSYKIFQMDYNSKTGEYRMLENFLPTQLSGTRNTLVTNDPSKPSKPKPKKRANGGVKEPVGPVTSHTTAGWPPGVSVHVVAWNSGNGLAKAKLLASGLACGLVRVEDMRGCVRDGVISGAEEEPESDDDDGNEA